MNSNTYKKLLLLLQYPAPALLPRATNASDATLNTTKQGYDRPTNPPGSLPNSASELTNPARGLLIRLLERDPKVRMRNLRQLQQSAFYMGFNFEHVKARKLEPRHVLDSYFPKGPIKYTEVDADLLKTFDEVVSNV
ncbi:hypothetical protein ACJJTC_004851 [Scirpophaga incertulas]